MPSDHIFHDFQKNSEKLKCENNKRLSRQRDFNFIGEECPLLMHVLCALAHDSGHKSEKECELSDTC